MKNPKERNILKPSLLLRLHSLPVVNDCSRSRLTHFNLCAYLLELRCLLLHTCGQNLKLLLLLHRGRLEVLSLLASMADRKSAMVASCCCDFAMLFEELIEQHRVHRLVAHGVRLSFLIAQRPDRDSPFPLPRPQGQTAGCHRDQAPACSERSLV